MKNIVKKIIQLFLKFVPLSLYKNIIHPKVTGLIYHAVSDRSLPYIDHIYPPVKTDRFEEALKYLKNHYNIITYEQLHTHRIEGKQLPDKALHLSFDDGYIECYTLVRPLLKKYNIPCTFFITSDWIDDKGMFYRNKVGLCIEKLSGLMEMEVFRLLSDINHIFGTELKTKSDFSRWVKPMVQADVERIDRICEVFDVKWMRMIQDEPFYLTSAQIKLMADEGFTIGSHTQSHPKLVQVTPEEMEKEIVESSRTIQKITDAEIIPFAFPNTATGIDRKILAGIRARHSFLGLFFDAKGFREDVPFIVNRIWAEKPVFSNKGIKTNLPYVLKDAFQEIAYEKILEIFRN
jgi:peptidoglycan/xylan/chitin deacetylase (PgdA/CDA1 family)